MIDSKLIATQSLPQALLNHKVSELPLAVIDVFDQESQRLYIKHIINNGIVRSMSAQLSLEYLLHNQMPVIEVTSGGVVEERSVRYRVMTRRHFVFNINLFLTFTTGEVIDDGMVKRAIMRILSPILYLGHSIGAITITADADNTN